MFLQPKNQSRALNRVELKTDKHLLSKPVLRDFVLHRSTESQFSRRRISVQCTSSNPATPALATSTRIRDRHLMSDNLCAVIWLHEVLIAQVSVSRVQQSSGPCNAHAIRRPVPRDDRAQVRVAQVTALRQYKVAKYSNIVLYLAWDRAIRC